MEWRLLGPVDAVVDGRPLPITRPQQRAVLAYLLLNANVTVSVEQLAEALWGGAVPASARTQIQVCVSRLRQLARAAGAGEPIASGAGGYRLAVAEGDLDLLAFTALAADARRHASAGAAEPAAALLRQALGLWRGPALAGAAAAFVGPAAAALHDERLAAYEDLFEAELALGRHAALVGPMRDLAAENPWRERLAAQLMTALARSGDQAQALRVYDQARRRLADELGVEPGAQLSEVHLQVLRQGLPPGGCAPGAAATAPSGPAQLPADLSSFTGREPALSALDAMLDRARGSQATAVVAIVGTAGVGKTALAVRWAHRVRHLFGDGQLFVDLGGFSPTSPMPTAEALSRCLRALGVPPGQVPDDLDEAAALLRSVLAHRRVLILLDNARDTAHIRQLLPGGADCLVIVTSRGRLDGLVARHDAQRLSLDVLSPAEADELLIRVLGSERAAGQHPAITRLAQACAGLPLALRIAAADLHGRPQETVAAYLTRLRDGDPLSILAVAEDEQLAVRHAFALSYRALPTPLRRLFRLFGLVPGCDVTAESAAAMLRCPPGEAAPMLSGLADAHLVFERAPGRFAVHDLLGLYATQLVEGEDNRQVRADLFDWYLSSLHAAADRLYPQVLRLPPAPAPARPPQRFASHVEARAWLDAQRHDLVTSVRHAADTGLHTCAWSLADGLRGYLWLGMHTTEWAEVATVGLAAAQADGHQRAEAAARLSLGALHWRRERFAGAIDEYERALACARRADWAEGQAAALGNLGPVYRMSGRPQEALRILAESLAMNQRAGRGAGAAVNHNNLGLVCADLGRLEQAAAHYQAALSYQDGAAASRALTLSNLAQVLHLLGHSDEALRTATDALRLHEQTGSRGQATALCILARVHGDRGDRSQAVRLAQQALAMAREPAEPRLEASALHALGVVERDTRPLVQALSLARAAGDRYIEAEVAVSLAELDEPAALSWCHAALSIARECGYRVLEGRAYAARAVAEHRAGAPAAALECARTARRLHAETGHQPGAERADKLLARLGATPS
ncbi:BTAD domain-containing putative transcriptional regulator [Catellatospora sp. KI3]|uniref:AfsR/SARP family transcriptional regulator n=1 Tax=Catellatospora sp. KI3 TaxID=3041620 RepID=UPI002482570A|nr:BTAD domain-containing putative transcriptional regulator [Catellatospora sp. KI3]MDI1465379.1 BTAD domain-containing putative transcriptional regulator [Catellatospora sp. KI3]